MKFPNLSNLFKGGPTSEPVRQDIVGLDISHSYIRAISLRKKGDNWTLHKLTTKILDEEDRAEDKYNDAVISALKTIKLEQKYENDNAAISLPVSSAIVQVIQIPFLEEKELNEATENGSLWESSINLPGDQSEYSIFWQTISKDPEKNTMSLLFVASKIVEVEKNCELIRKAGFDPLIVDVRCFALRNILRTYTEDQSAKDQVFIEISGSENYAVCMHNNLPFIYDIYVSDADAQGILEGGEALTDEILDRVSAQIRTAVTSFIKQSDIPGIDTLQLSSSLLHGEVIFDGLKKNIVEYKIDFIDPFQFIKIPPQLKTRLDNEKNKASLSVAIGLATRQLDVFGFYKFVTAVSNINLLPDREERIGKEKKKTTNSSLVNKLIAISSALLIFSASAYAYMSFTYPSFSDLELLQLEVSDLRNTQNKINTQHEKLTKWTKNSGEINAKILDFSYAASFPNGTFVDEIKHERGAISNIKVMSRDPSLAADIRSFLEKKFTEVELASIKEPDKNNLSEVELTFNIK